MKMIPTPAAWRVTRACVAAEEPVLILPTARPPSQSSPGAPAAPQGEAASKFRLILLHTDEAWQEGPRQPGCPSQGGCLTEQTIGKVGRAAGWMEPRGGDLGARGGGAQAGH